MKVVLDGGDAINALTTYHSMPLRIPSPDRVSMGISGWAQDYYFPEWNRPECHLISSIDNIINTLRF